MSEDVVLSSKIERLKAAKMDLDGARKRFAAVCQRYIEVSQAHTDAEMEVLTASRRSHDRPLRIRYVFFFLGLVRRARAIRYWVFTRRRIYLP